MLSHAFVESVSPGFSCPPAKLLGHSLNPEKWQERRIGLSATGRTCWSPSLPRVCLRAGRAVAPQPACPYRGPLITVLSPMILAVTPAGLGASAGLPHRESGDSSDPITRCVYSGLFYFFQPIHTVTLSASGFALLVRPEDHSRTDSRQL